MELVDEKLALPAPPPADPAKLSAWASALFKALAQAFLKSGYRVNRVLPHDGSEPMTGALTLATYTVATRPSGSQAGAVIFVSDGGAGAVFQGWNGAAWVHLG